MQGLIYDNKLVVKPGPLPEFYLNCPRRHRPEGIKEFKGCYAYEFIAGRHPTVKDLGKILVFCQWSLWRVNPLVRHYVHAVDKFAYIDYVKELVERTVPLAYHDVTNRALEIIRLNELPLAELVHGDLTFENIIIEPEENNLILIDPGNPRKAVTPSLDRGKLLQSAVMRWEERNTQTLSGSRVWENPNPWPGWANPLDWAFLVTHWVRLRRHWPQYDTAAGFNTLRNWKS